MGYIYAIIGAGRQGIAAGYDLIKFGNADEIIFVDNDEEACVFAISCMEKLIPKNIASYVIADVADNDQMRKILNSIDGFISAVPYYFNYNLTKLAIETKTHMCDLGGNTNVVEDQIRLNKKAEENGITVIPDCGMDPGMNISVIAYLLDKYDKVNSIKSYGAGLTQNPKPPWNFALSFHINGLTNEYFGTSPFIREGELLQVPCLDEVEYVDISQPIGKLEAAVTHGGLSTLPYRLVHKLNVLENKTLRYDGHWAQFRAFRDLGLFELEKTKVNEDEIVPRDFFHALLEPKIHDHELEDIGIIKVIADGLIDGKIQKIDIEIIDYYDHKTGFTAMQRLTGWHAAIMLNLAVTGHTIKGVVPVDQAADSLVVIEEIKKRGIPFNENELEN